MRSTTCLALRLLPVAAVAVVAAGCASTTTPALPAAAPLSSAAPATTTASVAAVSSSSSKDPAGCRTADMSAELEGFPAPEKSTITMASLQIGSLQPIRQGVVAW
ncbi:hypothetical protein [Actinoplanes sp. NPDC051494]|uniref:hypothetical protein n=1 Tax=Actinoplanes sp. NPDC051494 TaxID=3363907 RepID=UPI003788BB75